MTTETTSAAAQIDKRIAELDELARRDAEADPRADQGSRPRRGRGMEMG